LGKEKKKKRKEGEECMHQRGGTLYLPYGGGKFSTASTAKDWGPLSGKNQQQGEERGREGK